MTLDAGTTSLLLLALTLVVALAAARVLITSWARRSAVAERSALDVAERRAARMRSRLNRRLERTWVGDAVQVRISAAGADVMTVDFVLASVGIFLLVTLVANTIMPLWLAMICGVAALRVCFAWLDHQRERRRVAFVGQLPEIARILSNASSAGLAIRAAIEMAANELANPAKTEMRLVAEELAIGQSVEGALRSLERRMPSRDVGVLISTLVIQQRSGGDLVRALQDMADTLESRRDLAREIRTIMAGSVFTGYIVAGVGVATLLMMNVITPGVIDRLTTSLIGITALVVAIVLWGLGFLLVRRVTRFEV
jgi:tight adherence protein B